jgi:hypothetical protein
MLVFSEDRYYTSDVDLAAYLLTSGIEYLGLVMDGSRGFFTFTNEDSYRVQWLVRAYHHPDAPGLVTAKPFAAARVRLYREVRDALRGER